MIKIDNLTLNLPENMAHRSDSIIRHIGEALGSYATESSVQISRMDPINARISETQTNRSVGYSIAQSIARNAGMTGGDNG